MRVRLKFLKSFIREHAMDQAKLGIASSFPSGKVSRHDVSEPEDDDWAATALAPDPLHSREISYDVHVEEEPPSYDVVFDDGDDDLDATTDPFVPMVPDTDRQVAVSSRQIRKAG